MSRLKLQYAQIEAASVINFHLRFWRTFNFVCVGDRRYILLVCYNFAYLFHLPFCLSFSLSNFNFFKFFKAYKIVVLICQEGTCCSKI
jgi:hypothetical protein